MSRDTVSAKQALRGLVRPPTIGKKQWRTITDVLAPICAIHDKQGPDKAVKITWLAKVTTLSVSTVRNALAVAEAHGLIEREYRRLPLGGATASGYRLTFYRQAPHREPVGLTALTTPLTTALTSAAPDSAPAAAAALTHQGGLNRWVTRCDDCGERLERGQATAGPGGTGWLCFDRAACAERLRQREQRAQEDRLRQEEVRAAEEARRNSPEAIAARAAIEAQRQQQEAERERQRVLDSDPAAALEMFTDPAEFKDWLEERDLPALKTVAESLGITFPPRTRMMDYFNAIMASRFGDGDRRAS